MNAFASKRAMLFFVVPAILVSISIVLVLQFFFEKASGEIVVGWFNSERITLQQGNLLSAVTKLQRTVEKSSLLDSVVVVDMNGRILANVGSNRFEDLVTIESGEGLNSKRISLFNSVYWFQFSDMRVLLFTSAPLLLFVSLLLVLYFTGLLLSSGFLLRRAVISQEQLKAEFVLSQMRTRVAVAEALGSMAKQVAHDIRAPVSALRIAVRGANLSVDQKSLIELAGERINSIADDLLSESRTASSAFVSFEATSIIRSVVSEKQVLNPSSNIEVKIDQEFSVKGHRQVFARIISNILDNSIEAADPRRALKISVSAAPSGGEWKVAVSDNGAGMSSQEIVRVLNPGYRSAKAQGSGLGLAYAVTEMQRMGGGLEVSSELGAGTTVTLAIPGAIG